MTKPTQEEKSFFGSQLQGIVHHGGQGRLQEPEVDSVVVTSQEAQEMNVDTMITLPFNSCQTQHPELMPSLGKMEFLPQPTNLHNPSQMCLSHRRF